MSRTSQSWPTSPPLWRNVSFLLMWTSVAASGFGLRMMELGAWRMLGIELEGASAASIQASVSFFTALAYVLLGPLGGWLADTLPRKWIMLGCDEIRGLLLLVMIWLPVQASGLLEPGAGWALFAIIFGVGAMGAVFSPTRNAAVPQIVGHQQLQAANAIVFGLTGIAAMLGLVLGQQIIAAYTVNIGLMVGAATYLVSGTFFIAMRMRRHEPPAPAPQQSQWRRLIESAGYLRTHRRARELVLLSAFFWGAVAVFLASLAALAKLRFTPDGEAVMGYFANLSAAVGLGMLIGAVFIAWQNNRREAAWQAMLWLLLGGVCMLLLVVCPIYEAALALAFLAGLFGNMAMITVGTLLQSVTPNHIRGRIFGVRDQLNTIMMTVVNFTVWRLPDADGWMVPTLGVLAVLLMLLAGWQMVRQIGEGPLETARLNLFWRLCRAFSLLMHRVTWVGRHHVPMTGPVILAPNHTTGLDPLLIQSGLHRTIRWVMLTSYQFWWAAPLWKAIDPVALDSDSSNMNKIRRIVQHLKQDEIVGLFPEGGLQRDVRELMEFRDGVAMIAKRGGAAIVPVWIEGTPTAKAMIWHFLWPSRSTVRFGQPFTPDKTMSHEQIVTELRGRMEALARGEDKAW